jgi:EmrB/QacA subfamily drug resistance transporter
MTTMTRPRIKNPSTLHPGLVTLVVCLALAAVVAAMSSLNVALPGIARATHATSTQLAWIIDAYSLVFASLLLPAGAIGDRFGRRRALIAGLTIFGAGSAVAMTATSAGELIGLRAVIGLGAALVMPATLSTITGTFAAEQRTRAVSVWAAVAGAAAVLGLLVTGLALEVWSWPSVFGLNVVLAAIAIVGTFVVVPESADHDSPRLDLGGAALAIVGLVALVYSIIEAPSQGWGSARTLGGLAAGLVVLTGFVLYERTLSVKPTRPNPMLDPRIFARKALASGSLSIFVQFFSFFGFIFLVLQYLQLVRGDSGLVSAVSMLPMAAAMLPTTRFAPALAARFGSRGPITGGLVLIAAALIVLSQLTSGSSYWLIVAGLIPLGIGMGLAMPPATSGITSALPAAQQGVGSALNDLSREVGGAVGIAVLASVLTAGYQSHLPADAAAAKTSVAVAAHLGGAVFAQAQVAFTDGMALALRIAAGIALAAAIAIAILLRRRDATRPAQD